MDKVEKSEWIRREIFDDRFGDLEFEDFWDHEGHQFEGLIDKEDVKRVWDRLSNDIQEILL